MDDTRAAHLRAALAAARDRLDSAEPATRAAALAALHDAVRAARGVVPLVELADYLSADRGADQPAGPPSRPGPAGVNGPRRR